ncbi:MAG: UDP-N-acetylmuramoyl-L-alanyl-D-glutamate--2,6-diaminopimelate ligase [bacterium]
MHTLKKLIKGTDIQIPAGQKTCVRGLSYDSRKLKKGDLFFAIPGPHGDGAAVIKEAFSKGASAVVAEKHTNDRFKNNQSILYSKDIRKSMAQIAEVFYGNPSKKITVIGVTGTNGKTTITYLLEHILKSAGLSCGVIGTINYRYHNRSLKASTTTPQAIDLSKLLNDMHTQHVRYVCMEVSSHALALQRVAGIRFRGAVFTNLTRDHLDYHKNMNNYFKAKRLLFAGSDMKFGIINTDNLYGKRLRTYCRFPVTTYGLKYKQDISAYDVHLSASGSRFILVCGGKKYHLNLHLIGDYNVYNALAAAGAALALGVSPKHIVNGLGSIHGIPGRMEKLHTHKPFEVIVDYAHTNDALLNVLKTLQKLRPRRILTVFGCGGDRDRKKRPIMGHIAVERSHHVWVTLDNPRTEDPKRIMHDIVQGIRKVKKHNYSIVYDRKAAIRQALSNASTGDVVLIAGKGHEKYQILKDKTILFDDKQVALDILQS